MLIGTITITKKKTCRSKPRSRSFFFLLNGLDGGPGPISSILLLPVRMAQASERRSQTILLLPVIMAQASE